MKKVTINFHLWSSCNMACRYCYARNLSCVLKGSEQQQRHFDVLDAIFSHNRHSKAFTVSKINFAGGEPTLCPWINELATSTKNAGIQSSIITNGSGMEKLDLNLFDIIGLSVDSINPQTNISIGRKIPVDYLKICEQLVGKFLKINTVVSKLNHTESMHDFIEKVKPNRWKILQVLPIQGQNINEFSNLEISDDNFKAYVNRHSEFSDVIVAENNETMEASYIMINPEGAVYGNSAGEYNYSRPITQCGLEEAVNSIYFDHDKFIERGGIYV